MTTVAQVDTAARAAVIRAVADLYGLDLSEVEDQIAAAGGDDSAQLDSKSAEVILAALEVEFGCELPSPADLSKRQYSTVAALIELVTPQSLRRVDQP